MDDDRAIADALSGALGGSPYRVIHCDDPSEALRIARDERPDLVMLEIALAREDGLDWLDRLRRCDASAEALPVIVVTAAGRTPRLYARALQLGVRDYLTKPATPAQLAARVLEFTDGDASSAAVDLSSKEGAKERAASTDPETGNLADLPLPELLHALHARGERGVLIVEDGKKRTGIDLRNGSPVAVSTTGRAEPFPDFLLRTGRIDRAQHDKVVGELAFGTGDVHEILVGMGALSARACEAAESERAEERLLELFRLAEGRYRFQHGRRLKAEAALDLSRGLGSILLEGVLRLSPIESIRPALERNRDLFVFEGSRSPYRFEDVRLTKAQQKFVRSMQGDRSVGEILAGSEFEQRMLHALSLTGWLELCMDPVLDLVQEVADPADAAAEPAAPAMSPTEQTFSDFASLFSEKSDYEILGVGDDAGDDEVRRAYRDRLGSLPFDEVPEDDPELQKLATRVRARIESAYEHLRNAELRKAYDARRAELEKERRAAESATRAFEGESWFRKGQALLDAKRRDEAVEAFGMASHLDPSVGEYVAHLGYAMHLAQPDDPLVRKEALENIARGIKLAPDSAKAYLYLGRIFKTSGDNDQAELVFERALKIKPDLHAARQELRLLEMRKQKSSGFLNKLAAKIK